MTQSPNSHPATNTENPLKDHHSVGRSPDSAFAYTMTKHSQ